MRRLAGGIVVVAVTLAVSACGSGHRATTGTAAPSTQRAAQSEKRNFPSDRSLPPSLVSYIRDEIKDADGKVRSVEVYGPGSRAALVKASTGDVLRESAKEKTERFYLLVLKGRFVCPDCGGPATTSPFHGTVETFVWSRPTSGMDSGFGHSLPAAVSRLHRLAAVTLS